jgi:hypothetical protein
MWSSAGETTVPSKLMMRRIDGSVTDKGLVLGGDQSRAYGA